MKRALPETADEMRYAEILDAAAHEEIPLRLKAIASVEVPEHCPALDDLVKGRKPWSARLAAPREAHTWRTAVRCSAVCLLDHLPR
jgi:hypothetical protein